ncbi:MAG: hypothetical protein J5940_02030 [Clostridia bacterium]|nr:hypothetical protein [Clostridia bacterium]
MKYEIKPFAERGVCAAENGKVTFKATEDGEAFFGMEIVFPGWDDVYVMLPSCVYDGNPMKTVERFYPPRYRISETGVDCEPITTDVPGMGPGRKGSFSVTAGDLATPCVGIFFKKEKEGFLLFTEQHVTGKNLGFSCEPGKITVTYPSRREKRYRLCRPHLPSGDRGLDVKKGDGFSSDYIIKTFPCEDVLALYSVFFNERKCLLSDPRPENGYTKELWELMEKHFNDEDWSGEFYGGASKDTWQPGWVGGGMSTYPLLLRGSAVTRERAVKTIDFMTKYQAPSGFYYGIVKDGKVFGDGFGSPGLENAHHVRKSADALYFLLKCFSVPGLEVKPEWEASAKRCADAFCTLFERYGKFGQLVDVENGEMMVGTSAAGAMAPGALAKARRCFGDGRYLDVAERSAEYLYENYLRRGFTNGGPAEILCAADSESAFALLESFVALYEETGKPVYLERAEQAAHFCSSWVVSYSYLFPETSLFGRLGINTVGCVFANVQNKHAAPGICTLSGDCLYKLWKYTGDRRYLELILDIAYAIPQCVSTDERPFYSWDDPPVRIPAGRINERVNMSDWEGRRNVGSVFRYSCWCETSLILTFTELMKYEDMRNG